MSEIRNQLPVTANGETAEVALFEETEAFQSLLIDVSSVPAMQESFLIAGIKKLKRRVINGHGRDEQEIAPIDHDPEDYANYNRRFPKVSDRFTGWIATVAIATVLIAAGGHDGRLSDEATLYAGPGLDKTEEPVPIIPAILNPDTTIQAETAVPEEVASAAETEAEVEVEIEVGVNEEQPAAAGSVTLSGPVVAPPDAGSNEGPVDDPGPEAPRPEFRYMGPGEFVQAWYDAQPQPGTVYGERPEIYGDPAADEHIRAIAESRGYRLQPLSTTGGLNWRTTDAFHEMAAAASNEAGVDLWIVSGFRSVDTQRELFQERVAERFGRTPTAEEILSGAADDAIHETLSQRSAPGYSRHHSGYTLDLNRLDNSFMYTAAYEWLSADNFYNARRFGFIPSYPDGVQAGPLPESWEFVFIVDTSSIQ